MSTHTFECLESSFSKFICCVYVQFVRYAPTFYAPTCIDPADVVPGIGPIWLDDVQCTPTKREIVQCKNAGFGVHNCNHGEDVGVRCK